MDAIFTRTSVRAYADRPVEPEKLERLLRAGMVVPSARNQQPWEFYVTTDRARLQTLSGCSPYVGFVKNAGAAIVPCYRKEGLTAPDYALIDLSAATRKDFCSEGGVARPRRRVVRRPGRQPLSGARSSRPRPGARAVCDPLDRLPAQARAAAGPLRPRPRPLRAVSYFGMLRPRVGPRVVRDAEQIIDARAVKRRKPDQDPGRDVPPAVASCFRVAHGLHRFMQVVQPILYFCILCIFLT